MNNTMIKNFTKATLLSYSQIFFSYSQILGLLLLILTFFSPWIGFVGLSAVILSNLLSYLFNYSKEDIEKGYLGFNSLLIGMEIAYFFEPSLATMVLLFTIVISTIFLTIVMNYIFYMYFGVPSLTLPFVFMSIVLYLATYNYTGLTPRGAIPFNNIDLLSSWPLIEMYFNSLSIIFFQNKVEVGILIALIMFFYSPTMLFLTIISFFSGLSFYSLMGGSLVGVENAFVGFNFIFAGLAVGGIFFVSSVSSYVLVVFTVLITALVSSAIQTFVIFYGMPVFALPFNLVIFMVLIAFKQRGVDKYPKMVDFVPGKPEDNLNFYLKNIKRFGSAHINKNLVLPVKGTWIISQGADGKETHKDRWRWALDLQKLNYDNKVFDNKGDILTDYPTYKENVYSPVAGTIVLIENGIHDNKVGEVNLEYNWGNYIIINAGFGVYIKLAHLLKGSIKVYINQQVKIGDELGKIGNSGRSSYPHLHLQAQSMPMVGSDTIVFSFANYILHDDTGGVVKIKTLPKTNDIIENIEKNETIDSIFNLYINRELNFKYNDTVENIKVDIDFYGRRFMESKNGAKLYFSKTEEYFYFLDFEGSKNSVLYKLYTIFPLIPLQYKENLKWAENLFFSPSGIFKNYISFLYSFINTPYKKFNLKYGKKVRFNNNLSYLVYSNDIKLIFNEENFLLAIKDGDDIIIEQVLKEIIQ